MKLMGRGPALVFVLTFAGAYVADRVGGAASYQVMIVIGVVIGYVTGRHMQQER